MARGNREWRKSEGKKRKANRNFNKINMKWERSGKVKKETVLCSECSEDGIVHGTELRKKVTAFDRFSYHGSVAGLNPLNPATQLCFEPFTNLYTYSEIHVNRR